MNNIEKDAFHHKASEEGSAVCSQFNTAKV